MHYLIYQITNNINNKIYIGKHKTKDIDDDYFGSGVYLKIDQEKYGLENFTKTILFECQNEKEMNLLEQCVVNEEFLKRDDVYNLVVGGEGSFDFLNQTKLNMSGNWKSLSEHCKEIFRQTGQWPSQVKLNELRKDLEWFNNYRKNVSDGLKKYIQQNGPIWTGKHHTEETKQKFREYKQKFHPQAGEKNSQFGTKCMFNEELRKTKHVQEKQINEYIANGWKLGAIYNWEKYFKNKQFLIEHSVNSITEYQEKKQLQKDVEKQQNVIKKLEKQQKKQLKRASDIKIYSEMYEYYSQFGWELTKEKFNYQYSYPNFCQRCKVLLKEFVPQNGKKRGN